MILPLLTPAGSNFIRDFPGQNSINCDLIDDYAGTECLTTHPIGTYTPVLSALAVPPTLGGTNEIGGYYYKIFDQIYAWGFFRFGSGFSAGTGVYTMTLPFKAKSIIPPNAVYGAGPIIGNGFVWDDGTGSARQPVTCQLRTNQTMLFGIRMSSGLGAREVSSTIPITWAQDDGMKWSVRYQRDPL